LKFQAAPSRDHGLSSALPSARAIAPAPDPSCAHLLSLADGALASGAGGSQRLWNCPGSRARAVRDRSTPSVPTAPSRAAVTAATSRGGASPQSAATPSAGPAAASGLTASAAHNLPPSAGPGAARPADLPASFGASSLVSASRTTDSVASRVGGEGDRLLTSHFPPAITGSGRDLFHPPHTSRLLCSHNPEGESEMDSGLFPRPGALYNCQRSSRPAA